VEATVRFEPNALRNPRFSRLIKYAAWLPLTVLKLRQEKSKPILEKFKAWIDQLLPGTPPNSALGKALGYATQEKITGTRATDRRLTRRTPTPPLSAIPERG
jgi:hypothetical protein